MYIVTMFNNITRLYWVIFNTPIFLLYTQVRQLKEALNLYQVHRAYACFVDGRQFDYGTFLQIDDKRICYCSVCVVYLL